MRQFAKSVTEARLGTVRSSTTVASRNSARINEYARCGERTGPLTTPTSAAGPVRFRRMASRRQRVAICVLGVLNVAIGFAFIGWLLPGTAGLDGWRAWAFLGVHLVAIAAVVASVIPASANWIFAYYAKDPVPWTPQPGLRVALLTTIVPAREPLEMLDRTLTAMMKVEYDGQIDVWILDEGDDDRVKAIAERLGVHHFSRKGRAEYNQPEGAFRVKCKAGNHNAWLAAHGLPYDVVVQMDPDHVPFPWLLERCLGYFRDPDIAFVAMPHVYGNRHDNWVTYGASAQMIPWNSVTLRGGNGLRTPILEGSNHAYRPSAWRLIDGYQDALSEDRLTSMRILGTVNPATGNLFTGVYTPDVLTVGEAPSTWTDWFNQQKRWSYGLWQIYLTPRMRPLIRHNFQQIRTSVGFACHDFCKPVQVLWAVIFGLLTAAHLLLGTTVMGQWSVAMIVWGATQIGFAPLQLWLRRFYATAHEQRRYGLRGIALIQVTAPIIAAAGFSALLGRPLTYVVTAKGRLKSVDLLATFRLHLWLAAVLAIPLAYMVWADRAALTVRILLTICLATTLTPPLAWLTSRSLYARSGRSIADTEMISAR